jgi:diacylglycerol kinase family enzyme
VRVVLLHSEAAGDAASPDLLRRAVEGAGHQLSGIFATDVEPEAVLACSPELVVAAGGDGTVWRAATVVRGRAVALAILPLGTANNVATSLGIGGPPDELAARWHHADRRAIDLGVVRGGRGESRFLEAVGGGLVARAIASLSAAAGETEDPDARITAALHRYREMLAALSPAPAELSLDGQAVAGEFLLVEVMNIGAVGPNLALAPDADPADGLLEVVTAGEEHRAELDRYLRHRAEGRAARLELPTRRARAVDLGGWGQVHVDDEVRLGSSLGTLSLRVESGALSVLV